MYTKDGFYTRKAAPQRVQRYQCASCRGSFSFQSFQTTYWLKKPRLLPLIFHRVLACSAYRQIARELNVSHTTVMRQAERLGRHCLLFQEQFRKRAVLNEPLVVDGFESFEYSQFYPCHFHLAVGAKSHFFYAFTDSELRRKGKMTAWQKRRRADLEEQHGRPDPKSIEKEMAELLDLVPHRGTVELRSDEHPAYPRAIRRSGISANHSVTSSKATRTARNPLFPVNLLDLLIRHSSSNHKRETIAFSKRRQNGAEKLAILQVWRNFLKSFSERKGGPTPAQRLELVDRKLTVREVLKKRLFVSRTALPERLERYYRRTIETRLIPNGRTHRLRFAD